MREFCVLVFLGLNSWMDIKKREISLVLATMLAAAGMIWTVYRGTVSIERLLPIMTGVSFLGISVITRRVYGNGGRMDFACSGHSPDARRIFFHAVCSYVDQRGMGRYSAVVIS